MSIRRLLLLPFAVFATVATSAPGWSLEDETSEGRAPLAVGATLHRTYTLSATHPITTVLHLEDPVASDDTGHAKFHVTLTDSRGPNCSRDFIVIETKPGSWASEEGSFSLGDLTLFSTCQGTGGTLSLDVENIGDTPVSFAFKIQVEISSDEQNDVPPGAFVHIEPR